MEQLRRMSMSFKKGDVRSPGYYRKKHLEPLLTAALLEDPILADVPKNPSLADVATLIGVELGSSMMLTVRKLDGTSLDVAVLNTASMRDFKSALEKKVNAMEEGQMGHRHISWKHVWGNFCLLYNNEKLLNDDSLLREFGVKNGDELHFAHHITSREAGYHSRPKKRRFFHGLQKNISWNRPGEEAGPTVADPQKSSAVSPGLPPISEDAVLPWSLKENQFA